ncbi:MAG: hypothetical protein K6G68_02710 [Oscillospiraceae bacterium]|nr:hypothetical protein [Oscillospiraceae bacterium]
MVQNGMYYVKQDLYDIVRSLKGDVGDPRHRPVICLIPSEESEQLFWAIPMGNLNHRTNSQIERIHKYMSYPDNDIRSCYYHIGRTTNDSIFFISDVLPVIDKYIEAEHLGADKKHFILKNPVLIKELQRKVYRVLSYENSSPNRFRQHITDTKNYLLEELVVIERK